MCMRDELLMNRYGNRPVLHIHITISHEKPIPVQKWKWLKIVNKSMIQFVLWEWEVKDVKLKYGNKILTSIINYCIAWG